MGSDLLKNNRNQREPIIFELFLKQIHENLEMRLGEKNIGVS